MTLCSVISLCVKLENIKWTSSEHQGQGDTETATKKGGKFVPYYCVCVSVSVDGDVLVLELKEFYTRYTNDVIATAAFGIGVDSFKQPTNEFYMMGQDVTYLGGLRAYKWLAYITMPKLMQVNAVVRTQLHWAQSLRDKISSACRGIPWILRDLKVHHCIQNNPSLVPILSQIHPVHTLPPQSIHINFNIMLPSTSRSSKWSFSSHFPTTMFDESLFSPTPATHLAKIHFRMPYLSTVCSLNANIKCCCTTCNQLQSFTLIWLLHLVYKVQAYCIALYLCVVH